MNVVDFVKEKGLDVEEFNNYFLTTMFPLMEELTNSKELYEAAILYDASKTKSISAIEIHNNFNSIVAMIVYELVSKDVDVFQKHTDMTPGSLLIALSYFHYNLFLINKRGSVEYKKKYVEEVSRIIEHILENRSLMNQMHMKIIDMIKSEF